MSILRQIAILILLGGAIGGAWWWQARDTGEEARSGDGRFARGGRIPVVVDSVPLVREVTTIETVGTGRAARSITITASVSGEVTAILFEAGQRVERGEALLRLDDEDEQAAVELAAVEVEQAGQVLQRYEQAQPTGAVSDLEVDAARTELRLAQLQKRRAEIALANRTVRAPFTGVVGLAEVDVGERIDEGTAIATLDDRSTILVDFEIPEAVAGRLAVGDAVMLTAWSVPGPPMEGEVAATGSRLDPQTRTLNVRARVPNEEDRLLPGMSFAITLRLDGPRWPGVPEVAVMWDRDGAYVWRVAGEAAERVPVRIVRREGAQILVDGALEEGQLVVAEGVQRVRPGATLRIVNGAPPADGGSAPRPPAG